MKHMSMWITCILFIVVTYIWMYLRFFSLLPGSIKFVNIEQQYLPLIIVYFHPNIEVVFPYLLFCWIFHSLSLSLYCFLVHYHENILSSPPAFHWTKNPNTSKIKWQFFYCWNIIFFMKDINNFLVKNKNIRYKYFSIAIVFYVSHNSCVFLYLNDLFMCIEHLDMFFNIWNFISRREAGKTNQAVLMILNMEH